jgi:hypothetical protein
MTLSALIIVCGLLGILLFASALNRLRRGRLIGAMLRGLAALALCALTACALLIAANLRTYPALGAEQPAGEIAFSQIAAHQYNGVLTYPTGKRAVFALRGDDWQIDARIVKWRPWATVLGLQAGYRLERISGRYSNIDDERTQPRTVYALAPPARFDVWTWSLAHPGWLPGFDALYGSATYLPMTDGASYGITVTPSGLVARPLNRAAREAIGAWPGAQTERPAP